MAKETRTNLGDSAVIETEIFDDTQGTPANPQSVTWLVSDPNNVSIIVDALPSSPTADQVIVINQDINPFSKWDTLKWNGSAWIKVDAATSTLSGNQATFVLPPAAITTTGLYRGLARFILDNNITKSVPATFEVIDLLETDTSLGDTPEDQAVDLAWLMLEDLFDSSPGGPWLRDKTVTVFDKRKMKRLVTQAIYAINNEYQPITSFTEANFPYQQHTPLLAQALLVETIYHLIRSYAEQPTPSGSPITWFDRRDYMSRWQSILQTEEAKFMRWLDLFKQNYLTFGQGSLLIGGYATALSRLPRYLRTRYPRYIGPYTG